MDNFSKVNEVYKSFFKNDFPARVCIAVKTLPKNGLYTFNFLFLKINCFYLFRFKKSKLWSKLI